MVTETEGKGNVTIMLQEATGHVPVSITRCMKRLLTQDPVGTKRNKAYLDFRLVLSLSKWKYLQVGECPNWKTEDTEDKGGIVLF